MIFAQSTLTIGESKKVMTTVMICWYYSVILFRNKFTFLHSIYLNTLEIFLPSSVVMGNWKLNGSKEMVVDLLNGLNAELEA